MGKSTAEAIIIGGGIHGLSLAFHLAEKGVIPLILERKFVGVGATGRSSGLVRMHYDLEPEAKLAWESFQYFYRWRERVGGDCEFRRTGFIQIVRPEFSQQLQANVTMHQRLGIPSILIRAADVRRLAPSFDTQDFELAAYEPESGYADPNSTSAAFLEAARKLGAELVQDCEVTGIRLDGDRVAGVETTTGEYHAPVVVNTAGPWAGKIARMVGLEVPIDTWRHDTMFVRRPPEIGPSHPTVIDDANAMYFRPETGGLTLVGLEDGNPLGQSPDTDVDRAQAGFVERAVERICRRIPAMEGAVLHSSHGGYDGITPDQRAVLGQAGPEGFYLACGFSGTGFKIAPAVGACMAELIITGQASTVDIEPFHPRRFEEGTSLTGEHAYEKIWR